MTYQSFAFESRLQDKPVTFQLPVVVGTDNDVCAPLIDHFEKRAHKSHR